ncbi:FAD-binding oxidoreductase [Azospirillum sp. TSO35-2]|uniref:FAD-binding oxidoreductase n=1 Tax=Azospirillum sp. TSO35-2 TaxID=716796 RepID=UPI000D617282|nr:FAD-binding oxidoreductase [Azospirillum sp. TSO35-2]PWC36495.1 FAD-linked oxidase [Azospirillum sp. TSO35-2]
MTTAITTGIVAALQAALGPNGVRIGGDIDARHRRDWMLALPEGGRILAAVYPRDTAQVSTVLRLCHQHCQPVVPQGGLTGLAGGATPVEGCVVLSLERLRAIEDVDTAGATITVQAGVTMQAVQEAADAAGLFYPLDLGGRGSCQVGGNISTNAGGNRVLRYGMARDLVLGLEVVLADGTVVSALNTMLKNNAGYDLKQLFIGSEGTLGVVTRAVLRLHPKPRGVCSALCALAGFDAAVDLLRLAREELGGTLSAFEMMWPDFYRLAGSALSRALPLPHGHEGYVLVESMGTDQQADQERFERFLERAFEAGVVEDAVIARSGDQARALWEVRDTSGAFLRTLWPHVGFDVSIPVARIGAFVETLRGRLAARWGDAVTPVFFGHIADSNVHVCIKVGDGPQPEEEVEDLVYGTVREFRGSVSAEHGIGLLKKPYLGHSVAPEAVALMRTLKAALDPRGILNPGKVFDR